MYNMNIKTPQPIGRLHFVGIGGIGMSGIAEVLAQLGVDVSGSDIARNANIERLEALGVTIYQGHHAAHVEGADSVIISSAITPQNPELQAAYEARIPIVHRAQMLAELMRLKWAIAIGGTHGKTTTTSLVAHMLDYAGLDPTIINGGIINSYKTNARLGYGDWLVAEADESDGSFLRLPSTLAVVTNINNEHMEHYGDSETLYNSFKYFVESLPFYGAAFLCIDHPRVYQLAQDINTRKIITYGRHDEADWRLSSIRHDVSGSYFNVSYHDEILFDDMFLPMFGEHNILNSVASMAVGAYVGVAPSFIRDSLRNFAGVKRRFTHVATINTIRIIDDYAHHPVEIKAVLNAATQACSNNGRIIAVMQPHRYTRLHDLMDDFASAFADADIVMITPVYEAGEAPIGGVNAVMLANKASALFPDKIIIAIDNEQDLQQQLGHIAQAHDIILCMGAGSISQWADNLVKQRVFDDR